MPKDAWIHFLLFGIIFSVLHVIQCGQIENLRDEVRSQAVQTDYIEEPGRLPDLFIAQIQQFCEGGEACDFKYFSQPNGVSSVVYNYTGTGDCALFDIPDWLVADYKASPSRDTLSSWYRLATGPIILANACMAEFFSNVTFICTRPGIDCSHQERKTQPPQPTPTPTLGPNRS